MLYYIACHDAGRTSILAGPYQSEEDAQAVRNLVADMAYERDFRAHFYTYSLARTTEQLNTVFGHIKQ